MQKYIEVFHQKNQATKKQCKLEIACEIQM